jgi:hypothetical protein
MNLNELKNEELIDLFARIPEELKKRGVIRTKNFLGDLGEYVAIKHYNNVPGLPNLQAAPAGTQNVDAISRNGERYTIKATRGNSTGSFYGLSNPESKEIDRQKFEYAVIVQFSDSYRVRRILELTWEQFLKHKRWQSRIGAWNLILTKSLISDAKVLVGNRANERIIQVEER